MAVKILPQIEINVSSVRNKLSIVLVTQGLKAHVENCTTFFGVC
jgi:hypothetical protein